MDLEEDDEATMTKNEIYKITTTTTAKIKIILICHKNFSHTHTLTHKQALYI